MRDNPSPLKRHWKLILNVLTLIALAALVYAIRHQLTQTLDNLRHVNVWILSLMLPIELLNYHVQTKMYQHLFAVTGNRLKYRFLFFMSLELNFVNHVFPSGGVSGLSYFGARLRNGRDITAARATLVQVMKLALIFLSFEIMLIAGLFFLAVMGKASGLTMLVTGSLSTLLIVGTVTFTYIIGSKQRINQFFTMLTRVLNRLIQLVRPDQPETISISRARFVFDDLHANYVMFKSRRKELKAPFWYALAANITEVATLYVVYIAFGEWVNVGAVILAYAVANFAGLISVLPGGIGVYEALMTAVLAAGGVPPSVSLPVTVMYRVINTLIQLPPGYYLYHQTISGRSRRA